MVQPSWIELDKSALRKNIRYLQKRIGKDRTFLSVIKGNAYGHGIEEFVPLAEENGIRFFAVYDAHEAYRAFQVKLPESHIVVMGMLDEDQMEWAIEREIAFYIFTKERLEAAIVVARKLKKKARIHLELETGMYRTGLEEELLPEIRTLIKKNSRYLFLEGICTHFAGAESIANYARVIGQIESFNRLRKELKKGGLIPKFYHSACSAAALTYPDTMMDMVRFGIAQYGFWPSVETRVKNLLSDDSKFTRDPLKTVLSWKTRVMSIKQVKGGNFINYGNAYLATKNMRLATIPIGYYHGYRRSLSNFGHVLVHGKRAEVVGMVNMNMFMVNVTHLPSVKSGDEVVLIGRQGDLQISVASFSELSNMINYELLARLPYQIPRQVVEKRK